MPAGSSARWAPRRAGPLAPRRRGPRRFLRVLPGDVVGDVEVAAHVYREERGCLRLLPLDLRSAVAGEELARLVVAGSGGRGLAGLLQRLGEEEVCFRVVR